MKALYKKLNQEKPFASAVDEALINVLVAAGHIRDRIDVFLKPYGITSAQYNVLRILRGVYPNGHARCDIARRMIERAPDVTRLIDRLETMKLVERDRSQQDRRLSITRISKTGLELLKRVDVDEELKKEFSKKLNARDANALSSILERLYG
jgi:DNA-binding MarR family transcriptional regulator